MKQISNAVTALCCALFGMGCDLTAQSGEVDGGEADLRAAVFVGSYPNSEFRVKAWPRVGPTDFSATNTGTWTIDEGATPGTLSLTGAVEISGGGEIAKRCQLTAHMDDASRLSLQTTTCQMNESPCNVVLEFERGDGAMGQHSFLLYGKGTLRQIVQGSGCSGEGHAPFEFWLTSPRR